MLGVSRPDRCAVATQCVLCNGNRAATGFADDAPQGSAQAAALLDVSDLHGRAGCRAAMQWGALVEQSATAYAADARQPLTSSSQTCLLLPALFKHPARLVRGNRACLHWSSVVLDGRCVIIVLFNAR